MKSAPEHLEEAQTKLRAAPVGGRRLLVIVRFEELFAEPDGEARALFLDCLRVLIEGR